jgi:hypothetical protein
VENNFFCIAEHTISINFCDLGDNNIGLLPSFGIFRCEAKESTALFFSLTVDDKLRPEHDKKLIRNFDTGNGNTAVYVLPDGGYQYIIKDIYDRDCCLLICHNQFRECKCALNGDWTMRSFGLNNALMLAFAFAGAYQETLLIHASCIVSGEKGYPFTAKSGTGKSTHTSLWMKHIEGCELLNDDNPIIRVINGQAFIYGSPWSGKTPCYRNVKVRLGAIVNIERAKRNYIERLPVVQAFASLLPSCSSMKWDEELYGNQCQILSKVMEQTPVYTMHCLPDEEAAHVCHDAIAN